MVSKAGLIVKIEASYQATTAKKISGSRDFPSSGLSAACA
jgi:hypothetical protein